MIKKTKLLAAFNERCQSLKRDGYIIYLYHESAKFRYFKLRHDNRTEILLIADLDDNMILQLTNGILVHSEKVR